MKSQMRKVFSSILLLVLILSQSSSLIYNVKATSEYLSEESQVAETTVESEIESEEVAGSKAEVNAEQLPTTLSARTAEDGIIADVGNLRDGTASWNDQDGPGWDTGEKNGIVRTFDTVSYRVDFSYNNADGNSSDVIIRAIAPDGDYTWQTAPLIALRYDVTDNGDGSIDIRLPDMAAGSGAQTEIGLFVGEQRNGDVFKPVFEFYLGDTSGDPVTVLDQVHETTVSALSAINVVLNAMGSPDSSAASTHTFDANGVKYGRQYLGYELQLMKIPENGGTIKGMELPDPSVPLEFTIDLSLTKNTLGIVTDEVFYVEDVGYNNANGFLENTMIDHQNMVYSVFTVDAYKQRAYPFASSKSLSPSNKRYVEDSGTLEVTQADGSALANTSFLDRQYDSIKFSFTDFSGIKLNNERELRSDGSVPFATGGLQVVSEIDLSPTDKYVLTYTAEANMVNDSNTTDNKVNGVRTIDPTGARTWLIRRLYSGYTSQDASNGLGYDVLGVTGVNWTQTSFTGHYINKLEKITTVSTVDPRAFTVAKQGSSDNTWSQYGSQLAFDDIAGTRSYNDGQTMDYQTIEYGVVNFTQFGDIMDPKYYDGTEDTEVTTAGTTSAIDPIEEFILGIDGTEDESVIKWFSSYDDAVAYADSTDGWYLAAYKNDQNLEKLGLSTENYERVLFSNSRQSTLLNNEYTRYLFEHSETAMFAAAHWFDYKDDLNIATEIFNVEYYANNPSYAHYGEFGFRKTVYDENGDLVAAQYPSNAGALATNTLPLGAKPTIKKSVTGINGESLGESSITVPGIDEGVRWNIEVGLQSPFEIIEDTPLTVTDTVPLGLTLDEGSIQKQIHSVVSNL